MALQESGEMYLESILLLSKGDKPVRSIDVCKHIGYSKPSVSRAVGLLKQGGYIAVDSDGFITLTELGYEISQKIYERHTILTQFLVSAGVDPKTASEDACKMEHVISDTTIEAIKNYIK